MKTKTFSSLDSPNYIDTLNNELDSNLLKRATIKTTINELALELLAIDEVIDFQKQTLLRAYDREQEKNGTQKIS